MAMKVGIELIIDSPWITSGQVINDPWLALFICYV